MPITATKAAISAAPPSAASATSSSNGQASSRSSFQSSSDQTAIGAKNGPNGTAGAVARAAPFTNATAGIGGLRNGRPGSGLSLSVLGL